MKPTKKHFRELLNKSDYKHKNHAYRQRTRKYGDYLYAQDPIKFDVDYQEWLKEIKN